MELCCYFCIKLFPLDDLHIHARRKTYNIYSCRECSTSRHRKWLVTPAGRASSRKATRKSEAKHILKRNARAIFHYHKKVGNIIKPAHCEMCSETDIQAHHTDYSYPLMVQWLCIKHHAAQHRKKIKLSTNVLKRVLY